MQKLTGSYQEARTAAELYFEEDTLGFHKEMGIYHLFNREWEKAESHYTRTFYRGMDCGLVLWHTGRQDSARVSFQRNIEFYENLDGFEGNIGRIYAVLGSKELALSNLKKALDEEFFWWGMVMRKDPFLDPIREDPGFIELQNRLEKKKPEDAAGN